MYRKLDGLRRGKDGRKIDRIETAAENDIDALYGKALETAMHRNRKVFRQMRDIMDGKQSPPISCVTDEQKAHWKEKTLLRLMDESGIVNDMVLQVVISGQKAVNRIKKNGLDVYGMAYKSTMDHLEG